MPQRIQHKRTKGWRKPEGAVCVTRGTLWGNPFQPYMETRRILPSELGIDREKSKIPGMLVIGCMTVEECLAWYRIWAEHQRRIHERCGLDWCERIRGRDLMCWCPLDSPCHADILLEIANR